MVYGLLRKLRLLAGGDQTVRVEHELDDYLYQLGRAGRIPLDAEYEQDVMVVAIELVDAFEAHGC